MFARVVFLTSLAFFLFSGIASAEGGAELSGYDGGYEKLPSNPTDWPVYVQEWQSNVAAANGWDLSNRTAWNRQLSTLIEHPKPSELEAILAAPYVWNRKFANTLSDSSTWSQSLEQVLVADPGILVAFKEELDLINDDAVSPLAWVYGCGPIYGAKARDRQHLSRLCKVTGDDSGVVSALALDSILEVRLSETASAFMKSYEEFDRLVSTHLVHDYLRKWKDITKEDFVKVYFFDDKNIPIVQGTSDITASDKVFFMETQQAEVHTGQPR